QRTEGTAPEMSVRRALHARGLRYRLHQRPVPGLRRTADIVFRSDHVAVFVDGCFWHGCPEHGRMTTKSNVWYWPAKIERNRLRDADTTQRLEEAGWTVIRVWEHEPVEEAVARIEAAVFGRRA